MRTLRLMLVWAVSVALLTACDSEAKPSPTDAVPVDTVATVPSTPTSSATTTNPDQPPSVSVSTISTLGELPRRADHLSIGETWATTLETGCGYPKFINGTWWMPTTLTFTHPDYPDDWTVDILNLGPADGPTARIHNTTITLVDQEHIEIRLPDGQLVAIYEPTEPPGLCG